MARVSNAGCRRVAPCRYCPAGAAPASRRCCSAGVPPAPRRCCPAAGPLPHAGKRSRLVLSLPPSLKLRRTRRSLGGGGPLGAAASRDACGRHMPGAPMRRWSREIYADHMGGTRREESPRPFSGSAASCAEGFAAHGVLQGPRPFSTGTVQAWRDARRDCGLSTQARWRGGGRRRPRYGSPAFVVLCRRGAPFSAGTVRSSKALD